MESGHSLGKATTVIAIIGLASAVVAILILTGPPPGSDGVWASIAVVAAVMLLATLSPLLRLPSLSLTEWAWAIMISHTVFFHGARPADELLKNPNPSADIAGQIVVWLACLGLAVLQLVREPGKLTSLLGPATRWLALLLLLAISSATWSLGPMITLAWSIKLVSIILLACVLIVPSDVAASSKRVLRATYAGLLLMLALFLLFGLLSPSSAASMDPRTGIIRAGGAIIPPTQLAAVAGGVIVIALVDLLTRLSVRVTLAVLVLSSCLLLTTLGRGAMIACAASSVLVLFIFRRLRLATALLVGVVLLLAVNPALMDISWELITRREDADQLATLTGRTMIWELAFERFLERPVFGWGYVAGTRIGLLQPFAWWAGADAHNAYIEMLVNLGLAGAILLLALLVRMGMTIWRLAAQSWRRFGTGEMGPESAKLAALFLTLLIQGVFEQSFSGAPRFGAILLTGLAFCSDSMRSSLLPGHRPPSEAG